MCPLKFKVNSSIIIVENIEFRMISMDNKTAELIRKKRLEKGLTQEELAQRLFVSTKTISRWENGINLPEISILSKVAYELDLSVVELIDGDLEKPSPNESKQPNGYNLNIFLLVLSSLILIDLSYGFFKSLIYWVVNNKTLHVFGIIYKLFFSNKVITNYDGITITKLLYLYIIGLVLFIILNIRWLIKSNYIKSSKKVTK